MIKTKQQFLRRALIQTAITGLMYLLLPVVAKMYHNYIGDEYIGYTVAGGVVLAFGSLVLIIRAWVFVFDKDARINYNKEEQ